MSGAAAEPQPYLSVVYGLVWPSSVTSGMKGSADLSLWKGETEDAKIIKSSGSDLRRNKLIY